MRKISKIYGLYSHNIIFIKCYIIDKCNYKCVYCYNEKPRTNNVLNLQLFLHFIHSIYKQSYKKIIIELIGGEPTLHPGLVDFCNNLNNLNYIEKITIYSNFTAQLDLYYKLIRLKKVELNLSWHSINMSINENFIKKFMDFQKILNTDQTNRIIYSIMYEPKLTKLSLLVFNLISLKTTNIELLQVGHRENEHFIYQYSKEEFQHYNDKLNTDALKNIVLEYDDGYKDIYSDAQLVKLNYLKKISFVDWKCNAGSYRLYIDKNGDVYKCQLYAELKRNKMYNIYQFMHEQKLLLDKPTKCEYSQCACEYFIEKSIN